MDELLDKVIGADVIVLAVPVYFYSMAAQMKVFIDRCFARYTEIKNKQFYFIVTAADPQRSAAEETIAGLRGFLRYLPGAEEKGVVYGTGAWDKGDSLRHPAYGANADAPLGAALFAYEYFFIFRLTYENNYAIITSAIQIGKAEEDEYPVQNKSPAHPGPASTRAVGPRAMAEFPSFTVN